MPSVQANGITIEYDERGSGDPLLMVMGLGAQLIHWPEEFTSQLAARGFRVIRFDNRDAGLSTEFQWDPPSMTKSLMASLRKRDPGVGYTLSDMSDDAFGLMDALGIQSAHIVGASMGGMIAQTMAIEHPERVRSLTSIMSHTGDRKNGNIAMAVLPAFMRHKPVKETAAETGTDLYARFVGSSWDRQTHLERSRLGVERSFRPQGGARQIAAIAASPDRTPDLRRLDVPTLVIHGLQDKLVKPSGGYATVKAIPGAQLLVFPDMGHDLPMNRWDEMITAIRHLADRAENGETGNDDLALADGGQQ